jgi:DNA-binding NarL/FixJ family response regulator
MMEGPPPSSSARDADAPIATRGRVIVVDDDVLFREGLVLLLGRSGFEVVAQAHDAVRILDLVREHMPDLVVLDVRMPPTWTTEGLMAATAIRRRYPSVAILVLSAYVEVHDAVELLSSGDRVGYLLKGRITDVPELVDALGRILKGGSVIDPHLVRELFAGHGREDPLEELSEREREVLALMAEGRTNAGIALKLSVREGTVEKHVRNLMTKLCLPATEADHRRVLAVLRFLEAQ